MVISIFLNHAKWNAQCACKGKEIRVFCYYHSNIEKLIMLPHFVGQLRVCFLDEFMESRHVVLVIEQL
jgi:hypothetical protein